MNKKISDGYSNKNIIKGDFFMRKKLATFAGMIICIFLFAGCGKNTGYTNNNQNTTTSTAKGNEGSITEEITNAIQDTIDDISKGIDEATRNNY